MEQERLAHPKPRRQRSCIVCGRDFEIVSNKLSCSPECARKRKSLEYARKRKPRAFGVMPCATCGVEFAPTRWNHKYCCYKCQQQTPPLPEHAPRTCAACGAEFVPYHVGAHKYCSSKCRGRLNARRLRALNPEKHRDQARRLYAKDPAKAIEATRRWRLRHPECAEKRRELQRRDFAKNPDKFREKNRRGYWSKPDVYRAYARKTHAVNGVIGDSLREMGAIKKGATEAEKRLAIEAAVEEGWINRNEVKKWLKLL
jgi:hypothetical protein